MKSIALMLAVAVLGGTLPPRAAYAQEADVATLESTPWLLVTYVDRAERTWRVLPGSEIVASFDQGHVSGSAGCNSYGSMYLVDGSSISFAGVMTTLRACASVDVMEQEQSYLKALSDAASFVATPAALTLHDADGVVLLTYVPQLQSPLEGTVWTALSYNNGRGGVVTVLTGTEITARFEEGQLTGSGGCNSYMASYTTDGPTLQIGPVAATRRACGAPPGVMEQESAYLAALSTVRSFRIEGDRLTLVASGGATAAVFLQ